MAVIDANDVVHVAYDLPDSRTVGSTWCQIEFDIGYYPADTRTTRWMVRSTNAPTCLTCIREVEHEWR